MPRLNKINRSYKKARLAKLPNFHELLITIIEKIKNDLINKINCLSEKKLISYFQLLINMVYKDGSHKDEILSPYLQKKAMEWILINQGKPIINLDQEIRLLKIENSRLK